MSENQEIDKSFLNKRVLLVEDNEINAEVMVAMLEVKNIEVEVVYDGEEAVDKFETSAPGYYNAILMDIEMPVMNGVEASKVIRNLHKQDAMTIPIISVTANPIFENIFFSRKYGMDDYVGKPIEPENLYAVLKKWFDKFAKQIDTSSGFVGICFSMYDMEKRDDSHVCIRVLETYFCVDMTKQLLGTYMVVNHDTATEN